MNPDGWRLLVTAGLILCVATVGITPETEAGAAAPKPKKRSAEHSYPPPLPNSGLPLLISSIEFPTKRKEAFARIVISDISGRKVDAIAYQDGFRYRPVNICGASPRFRIEGGKNLKVNLYVGFSSCPLPEWPSLPTMGTVKATFYTLPRRR